MKPDSSRKWPEPPRGPLASQEGVSDGLGHPSEQLEGAEGRVKDLKRAATPTHGAASVGLSSVLTGGKELTEKSQLRGLKDPQNPESPIVCPTWRRMKQSADANSPPGKGKIAAMTQELRHLKGSSLPQERSCVEKGSNSLIRPQPESEMEAEAQEQRA
jgi:hypothetical protein